MALKYNLPETNEMIAKLLRFQALFINTERTEGEQTEYNQLLEDLEPYQVRAVDFNNKADKDEKIANAEHADTADSATTATTAGKWKTARKITVGGDAAGEITIDGSSDGTLTLTINKFMPKTGGTFTGIVKAQNNTAYTTKQVRNIILSTQDANASLMENGDIWIKYE